MPSSTYDTAMAIMNSGAVSTGTRPSQVRPSYMGGVSAHGALQILEEKQYTVVYP